MLYGTPERTQQQMCTHLPVYVVEGEGAIHGRVCVQGATRRDRVHLLFDWVWLSVGVALWPV
jgi:hypothetical protein